MWNANFKGKKNEINEQSAIINLFVSGYMRM